MNLSNPVNLLIAGVYFIIVVILTFFSIFGVYILVRYGKSTPLALTVAVVYSLFYLKILSESYLTLTGLIS